VAFYVRKTLATGALRFGVQPGEQATVEPGAGFSTGPRGEFVRRSAAHLVFGDERDSATAAAAKRMKDDEESAWAPLKRPLYLALFALGAILVLLGFLVVARKGPQGWIEVVLGAILIAIPFIVTAEQRRRERVRLEAERKERAEEEARLEAMTGELKEKLEQLRDDYRPAALATLRRERISRDVPYEVFMPVAKKVAVDIAFDSLARSGDDPALFASHFDSVVDAVGLRDEDAADVKAQVLERLFWHLAADGRITPQEEERFDRYARELGIDARQFSTGIASVRQLRAASGLSPKAIPETTSPVELKFRELCHYVAPGRLLKKRQDEARGREIQLVVTSGRVVLAGAKQEVPLASVYDLEADADRGTLSIATGEGKVLHVSMAEPITAAAVIDAARQRAAERPRML
jgi:hypothetical protein